MLFFSDDPPAPLTLAEVDESKWLPRDIGEIKAANNQVIERKWVEYTDEFIDHPDYGPVARYRKYLRTEQEFLTYGASVSPSLVITLAPWLRKDIPFKIKVDGLANYVIFQPIALICIYLKLPPPIRWGLAAIALAGLSVFIALGPTSAFALGWRLVTWPARHAQELLSAIRFFATVVLGSAALVCALKAVGVNFREFSLAVLNELAASRTSPPTPAKPPSFYGSDFAIRDFKEAGPYGDAHLAERAELQRALAGADGHGPRPVFEE